MKRFLTSLYFASFFISIYSLQTCYPSRWGPDDEISNLNYITPAKTLKASKLIKTGKSYRLGSETNADTPAFPPPKKWAFRIEQPNQENGPIGHKKFTYNDDVIEGWVGIGSQIDGLGHIGIDSVYYNCNKASDFVTEGGLKRLGIETLPAIATRAVLLDMTGYFGKDPVPGGTAINKAEIEGAMKRQGIQKIEPGDVVLIYTGWLNLLGVDNERYLNSAPGIGVEGAHYLASFGIAAVGTDTNSVEVIPNEPNTGFFEVHQTLIPKYGIYLLENMDTEEMVKDEAWESFFTLGATRITGGVQAIINPICIV